MGVSVCWLAHQGAHINTNMGDNPEIWKAAAMQDHFEKIQKLPDKVDGVPNFRRVPGYKDYCCGQPTIEGFTNALNKACGEIYPKTNKIIWLNMRQEPIVYVNGNPVCARPPNKIGEYAELGDVTRESVKKDEEEFIRVLEGRAKGAEGKIKVIDVNKKESEVEVKDLITLSSVIEKLKETFPGLVHMRIPVCNSAAPTETDFDNLCRTLQGSAVNTPVIVNCQVGCPDPPLAVLVPVSSENSSWLPLMRALLRPFPVSTLTSSRWTDTRWTCPRIPCSEVSLRLSKSSLLSLLTVRPPRGSVTRLLTKMAPPRPVALVSSS